MTDSRIIMHGSRLRPDGSTRSRRVWRRINRARIVAATFSLLGIVITLVATPTKASAIVGGTVAPGGYYDDSAPDPNPYAFVGRLPHTRAGSCTAALVAPSLALTAGHCLAAPGDQIVFGVLNWDRYKASKEGISTTVKAVQNQGDDPFSAGSSTELIELSAPIWNIPPVRLASPADSNLWTKRAALKMLGFGDITPDCPGHPEILSAELRSATMKVVDTAVTTGLYRDLAEAESMNGYPQHGDSGGPLVATDANGNFVLVGIYQAALGACGHNYGYYYDRMWTQRRLRDYVTSRLVHVTQIASYYDEPAPIQGETFFSKSLNIRFQSGSVALLGSPDGRGDLWVDDALFVHIRQPNGSDRFLTQDFSNRCDGVGIHATQSIDLTSLLGVGNNQVFIQFSDVCGQNEGNSDVYVAADGAGTTIR